MKRANHSAIFGSYPRLTTSLLTRLKFFESGVNLVGLYLQPVKLIVHKDSDVFFSVTHQLERGEFVVQHIGFSEVSRGPKSRIQFNCPITEENCEELLLCDGFWGSRAGHGLRRRADKAVRRREKLLEIERRAVNAFTRAGVHAETKRQIASELYQKLRDPAFFVPNAWRGIHLVSELISKEQARGTRNGERSRHPAQHGLKQAIEGGYEASGSVELGFHFTRPWWNTLEPVIKRVSSEVRGLARQEDHQCLDLALLRSKGWLEAGARAGWVLDWASAAGGFDRVLLVIDLVSPELTICVEFLNASGMRVASQLISLSERPSMPARLFLTCPVRQTLHDRLFLRDGFFASAPAQRLKTASQFSSPRP